MQESVPRLRKRDMCLLRWFFFSFFLSSFHPFFPSIFQYFFFHPWVVFMCNRGVTHQDMVHIPVSCPSGHETQPDLRWLGSAVRGSDTGLVSSLTLEWRCIFLYHQTIPIPLKACLALAYSSAIFKNLIFRYRCIGLRNAAVHASLRRWFRSLPKVIWIDYRYIDTPLPTLYDQSCKLPWEKKKKEWEKFGIFLEPHL